MPLTSSPKVKRPMCKMTALDVMTCLNHARGIDPLRGARREEEFDRMAHQLGYEFVPGLDRDCPPGGPHDQDCGRVRPK